MFTSSRWWRFYLPKDVRKYKKKPMDLLKIKTIFAGPQAKIYLIMTLKNVPIY